MSSSSSTKLNNYVANPSLHGALSNTSIALICAFVLCFSFFVYLSSKAPRISEPVRAAAASRPRRTTPRRPKPKLWDVWLDRLSDPHHELKPPGAAVCNWHPLAAWPDDDDPALAASQQGHPHPDMLMSPHVAIAQAWFRGAYAFHPERPPADQFPAPTPPALPPPSDPRMLKLVILVAMPSRRKLAPTDPESPPRAAIGSGLSYNEGQLLMGVTSVPCEEQTIGVALRDHERTP